MDETYGQSYALPENRDAFVDVEKGQVVDKKDIPPLEVIRAMAKRLNIKLSDPAKNCPKCFERGYVGIDASNTPIMCQCLFRHLTPQEKMQAMQAGNVHSKFNRAKRRQMEKNLKKKLRTTPKPSMAPVTPITTLPSEKSVSLFPVTQDTPNG